MSSHVVILGCGRSGTSIFGELFEHLPVYTYLSEPLYEDLITQSFSTPVAIKVPKKGQGFPPTPGLSFPLPDLMATIPDPKQIFWQIRHPLDTICSLQVGISKNWGHHPKPPDWQEWLSRPLLERCAHHWNYINDIGYEQVKDIAAVTRFEEMVIDPFGFALNICEQVGLDNSTCSPELEEWSERVQNTNNEKFVEAKTSKAYSRKDHSVRIGRWKENLSKKEIASILPIISHTSSKLGYELAL